VEEHQLVAVRGGVIEDRGAIAYDATGFDPNTAVRVTPQAPELV
jgi:hypothetical protein